MKSNHFKITQVNAQLHICKMFTELKFPLIMYYGKMFVYFNLHFDGYTTKM